MSVLQNLSASLPFCYTFVSSALTKVEWKTESHRPLWCGVAVGWLGFFPTEQTDSEKNLLLQKESLNIRDNNKFDFRGGLIDVIKPKDESLQSHHYKVLTSQCVCVCAKNNTVIFLSLTHTHPLCNETTYNEIPLSFTYFRGITLYFPIGRLAVYYCCFTATRCLSSNSVL